MNDREHARNLLVMADKDLKALQGMTDTTVFAEEVFGFHARQAVEKALKAWIAVLGVTYPFTHDISRLLSILEEHAVEVAVFWSLVEYNAYAVQFRYEAFEAPDTPLDRPAVIAEVRRLYDHVHAMIEADEGQPEASGDARFVHSHSLLNAFCESLDQRHPPCLAEPGARGQPVQVHAARYRHALPIPTVPRHPIPPPQRLSGPSALKSRFPRSVAPEAARSRCVVAIPLRRDTPTREARFISLAPCFLPTLMPSSRR